MFQCILTSSLCPYANSKYPKRLANDTCAPALSFETTIALVSTNSRSIQIMQQAINYVQYSIAIIVGFQVLLCVTQALCIAQLETHIKPQMGQSESALNMSYAH